MRVVALILLTSGMAFADPFPEDRPYAVDVSSGLIGIKVDDPGDYEQFEITGGRYFNQAAVLKLDKILLDMQVRQTELEVENETLKKLTKEVADQPSINVKNVWLAAGIALAAGVLVGGFAMALHFGT